MEGNVRHVGRLWLSDLGRDLRDAFRTLRKAPAFSLAATAALTIGIGANTAVFSVVNAVLLKPLTFREPDRLVMLLSTSPQGPSELSSTKFEALQEYARHLQELAVYRAAAATMRASADPEQVATLQVRGAFFDLLGARVAHGRPLTPADDDRAAHVVVLSHGFWQRRFGGDPGIVGRGITLDDQAYSIVGVLGAEVVLDELPYLPAGVGREIILPIPRAGRQPVPYLLGMARLRPGATLAMANDDGRRAADAFARMFPNETSAGETFHVEPLRDTVVGAVRLSLLVLLAAVGLVLLIACANVANLLLVRASIRSRELAVRAALGASRSRLVRQVLAESLLLAILGSACGLLAGVITIRELLAVGRRYLPRIGAHAAGVDLDWRLLSFTGLMCITTAMVFGLLPALRAGRVKFSDALGRGSLRSGTSARERHVRSLLVVAEVALAMPLVIGATLLIRSFVALRAVDPGFEPRSVLLVPMPVNTPALLQSSRLAELSRRGIEQLEALPSVVAAGTACCLPMIGSYQLSATVVGRPLTGPSHGLFGWTDVSPGYFETLKIPVIRGRALRDTDNARAAGVVAINQTMARQLWPDGDPLNDRLVIGSGFGPAEEAIARQIVGIVGDVRGGALERAPTPMMYVPTAQVPDRLTALHARAPLVWIVRTSVEPHSLNAAVQKTLLQASDGIPAARLGVRSMEDWLAESTARGDFRTLLMTVFAVAALLLAALGIYGVMAHSVQQRTREIGIRMALGAESRDVRTMVVVQGMGTTLVGVVIGMASAFWLTRVLAGFLFGVTPHDPATFVAVPFLLSAVAVLAVWLPARRATRIDPLTALRSE
jgi:putative ABC transport system permease protein